MRGVVSGVFPDVACDSLLSDTSPAALGSKRSGRPDLGPDGSLHEKWSWTRKGRSCDGRAAVVVVGVGGQPGPRWGRRPSPKGLFFTLGPGGP